MQKKIRNLFISVVLVVTLLFSTGFASKNFEIAKNLDIFATLYRELHLNYIEEVDPTELMHKAINEMLSILDPYTTFIPESDIEDSRLMTTGQYGGVGAVIQTRESKIVITEPYKGAPAQKAGLKAGDIIIEVNGQSTKDRSSQEVAELLKGQPGTSVNVLVKRKTEPEPLMIKMTRERIKIDNIPYHGVLNNNIGYIKLTDFTRNAGTEVREVFKSLVEEENIESIILDLRDNGGGLLHEAVNTANLFIEKDKKIVSTESRIEDRNRVHYTTNHPIDKNIPLVVLVNRRSASASEIVSGAIQDYDRGVVIGERTFGKGLVQNIVPLSYNTQLKVTVAEYLIPSGRRIQSVDYAVRREDGSASRIPDSLKVPYETKNGRIVYDGGGIEPDKEIEPPTMSNITFALYRNHLLFDFATNFYYANKEITDPKEFEISKSIYNDFLDFISDKDYDYETSSERKLRELKQAMEEDDYYEELSEHAYELKNYIIEKKGRDLETFKDEIKFHLMMEIIPRYYFQRGKVEASLSEDDAVIAAIELLSNKEKYNNILMPNNEE